MRYLFIQEHQGQFRTTHLLRMLDVSPSPFYGWQKRPLSQRVRQKELLVEQISHLFAENKARYGSQKCMARLMKEKNLAVRKPHRFVASTDSEHAFLLAQNLLNREHQSDCCGGGIGQVLGWRNQLHSNRPRQVECGGRSRLEKPQSHRLEHEGELVTDAST
jgi:transposase InsO family protein